MLWLLVVSAGLFALVGERSEAVVLLVAIAPLFGIDAFLHGRTQISTAALATRSQGDRTSATLDNDPLSTY
ncbi:hypothetical protein [Pseudoxanthomonas mexicana]